MRMEITDLTREHAEGLSGIGSVEQFSLDVLTGLCSYPKSIPAKYFYDDKGSSIFQQITRLDEYYLTRSELDILKDVTDYLPALIRDDRIDIIELGPGDGSKSRIVIDGLLKSGCEVCFYPIDISAKALDLLARNLNSHRNLAVQGIVAEYFEGLRYARGRSGNRQLVLFLGSNIGNFDRKQNQAFLRRIWKSLNADDYLIVGFDLKKDVTTLTRAYNDALGLTREFNLNVLRRVNDELGGNFAVHQFEHFGVYNPVLGAMESYLLSKYPQEVYISELERSFQFEPYEPLLLEYSFKFLSQDIEYLCEKIGFKLERNFYDSKRYFVDSLWSVRKGPIRDPH